MVFQNNVNGKTIKLMKIHVSMFKTTGYTSGFKKDKKVVNCREKA